MSKLNTTVVGSLIARRLPRGTAGAGETRDASRARGGLRISRTDEGDGETFAAEQLGAERHRLKQAIDQARLVSDVIGTVDSDLAGVGSMLNEARTLVAPADAPGGDAPNGRRAAGILDRAAEQVGQLRGRLGAFEELTIRPTLNRLGVALENTGAARSAARDGDFAYGTSRLTRPYILAAAASRSAEGPWPTLSLSQS